MREHDSHDGDFFVGLLYIDVHCYTLLNEKDKEILEREGA